MPRAENDLIDLLPPADRKRLLARCDTVTLTLAEVVCEAAQPAQHAYFPVTSFISLLSQRDSHPGLEVGMVGREGMLGAHLALGVQTTPLHALVQGAGTSWRIGAAALHDELTHNAALRSVINRYIYVLMAQLAASATCLRYHLIGPRLARWLLMSQDRARTNTFPVTQEFLAYMLGVRRGGITAAAGALQRSGLIAYQRGQLSVLDRSALKRAACSCYAADRQSYAAQLSVGSKATLKTWLLPATLTIPTPLRSTP